MKVTERIKLLKQFAVVFANEHSVNFAICSIRRQRVRAKHSSNHKNSQMLLCNIRALLCNIRALLCNIRALLCNIRALLCFATSVLCFATSVLCFATSVLCFATSVLCFATSVLCFATSVSQKELASRPRARRPELPSKIPGSL